MEWLIEDTAVNVTVGPFLDVTDGVTPETGLAATMDVKLSKNGGAFASRNSATAITHDVDGYYIVPLDITDTGTLGRLRLQVTNESVHLPVWELYRIVTEGEFNAGVGSSGSYYVTAAEVQTFKVNGAVVDLSDYTDDEIDAEIFLASEMVEEFTDDRFYTWEEVIDFDGKGRPELYFSPQIPWPISSLNSLVEVDEAGTTLRTWTENQDFIVEPYKIQAVKLYDLDRPRKVIGGGGTFPFGNKNIRVDAVWGKQTVPFAVKRATMLLTLESLKPGSTGMQPYDVKQHSWPDLAVTYKGFGQSQHEAGNTTGFPKVDRLLRMHVNQVRNWVGIAVPEGPQIPLGR